MAIHYQNLVRQHIFERYHHGLLTGSPLTDVKVTLLRGRAHVKHTSGGDFREATSIFCSKGQAYSFLGARRRQDAFRKGISISLFMYVFSIVLIVVSNVLYNIAQKSTPQRANPFLALLVTYLTAAALTFIAYLFSKSGKGFVQSLKELNWTSLALGLSIVGLELGYILAYRAGWKISVGSLVANISLAVILIPIGILFYKEGFGGSKLLGAAICILGLILINK